MRKILEIVALFGSNPLPARIPTHFNAAGQPDGWGTPAMLWLLPAIAGAVYLSMSLVARYPAAFNFPVHTTPASRAQLEATALNMMAWLKAEVVCLFAWIQHQTIQFARHGQGILPPMLLPAVLAAIFWHHCVAHRGHAAHWPRSLR